MSPSVPPRPLPESALELLESFGGGESDLYRALANNPAMLEIWIRMAWGLRTESSTDRALREIMILLSADRHSATYQWADHTEMAREAGVTNEKIGAIPSWRTSDLFDETERAALAFMDEMISASVSDDTLDSLSRQFDDRDRIELILTAGFYCMVPRVLDALRLEV